MTPPARTFLHHRAPTKGCTRTTKLPVARGGSEPLDSNTRTPSRRARIPHTPGGPKPRRSHARGRRTPPRKPLDRLHANCRVAVKCHTQNAVTRHPRGTSRLKRTRSRSPPCHPPIRAAQRHGPNAQGPREARQLRTHSAHYDHRLTSREKTRQETHRRHQQDRQPHATWSKSGRSHPEHPTTIHRDSTRTRGANDRDSPHRVRRARSKAAFARCTRSRGSVGWCSAG